MRWTLAAVAGLTWLLFLSRGRTRGGVKRLALRATLLGVSGGLVFAANARGLFARSTAGFRLAILLALVAVAVGYLYTTRFCPACGRMVRNLKRAQCPRCQAFLPRHGMTSRPRTPGSEGGRDPLEPRRRGTRPGGVRPRQP